MRIGLLIQGPLVSTGKTGQTANLPTSALTDRDFRTFDCTSTITEWTKSLSAQEFLVSTWQGEPTSVVKRVSAVLGRENILLNVDPFRNHNTSIYSKERVAINGKRQLLSTLLGVRALIHRGCTHIIKVRTDQLIKADVLLADFFSAINLHDQCLFTPYFDPRKPWRLSDFFFGADSRILKNQLEFTLSMPSLDPDIHVDLFLRWSQRFLSRRRPATVRQLRTWRLSYMKSAWDHFAVAQRETYDGIVWRGAPLQGPTRFRFADELHRGRQPGVRDFIRVPQLGSR